MSDDINDHFEKKKLLIFTIRKRWLDVVVEVWMIVE